MLAWCEFRWRGVLMVVSTKDPQEAIESGLSHGAPTDVLHVFAPATCELQNTLSAITERAASYCGGYISTLFLRQGDMLVLAAYHGPIQFNCCSWRLSRRWVAGSAILDCRTVHIRDLASADSEFADSQANSREMCLRTTLSTPLLRSGQAIGALTVHRNEVRPFTDGEISLLTAFADHADIAIENAQQIDESRRRTKELEEARSIQNAISDILSVISRSPNDVQPMFDAIVENATRLCEAEFSVVGRLTDGLLHLAAINKLSSQEIAAFHSLYPRPVAQDFAMGRAVLARKVVQIADVLTEPGYDRGTLEDLQHVTKYRTFIAVPILHNGVPIGVIGCGRREVRPFTTAHVDLVRTFADHAVIAIENTRLFEVERALSIELLEALEYQTATSKVLGVISRSPTDVQPVFDTIAESAAQLCDAQLCFVYRFDGKLVHFAAHYGLSREALDTVRQLFPCPPGRGSAAARAVLECDVVQIPDVDEDADFLPRATASVAGYRSVLAVPMIREGRPIGAIALGNAQAGLRPARQVGLLQTFADQAVIAIENSRLFEEVETRTSELTRSVTELKALSEVGQAISSTLDIKAVLSAILVHACDLANSGSGAIYVFDHGRGVFELEAGHCMSDELIAAVRERPVQLGETLVGECAIRREPLQIEDLSQAPSHPLFKMHLATDVRALLAVPLLHQDDVVGALVVRRKRTGSFEPETIGLLKAFAAQSAIAIHNARLFREIEEKSLQLEMASRHKSQFLANMSHELRTPLNAIIGYGELMHDGVYGELPERTRGVLERLQSNGRHLLGLINDVLDLAKIEAGQLVLRMDSYSLSDVVQSIAMATDSLAAAKKLAVHVNLDRALPVGRGDEQRITQVLLNLVGNAIKFTELGEVRITARAKDDCFVVTVGDTGPGIPAGERDRIFDEFHQVDNSNTKTKGGTGLGLAISKRIVKMHGGELTVHSEVGLGSTFTVKLPIQADDCAEGS